MSNFRMQSFMVSFVVRLFVIATLFVMVSCGPGGGGDNGSSPPTTQSIAGIWIGAFSSNVTHKTFDVLGVITEQGIVNFTSISLNTQYSATVLNVSGNNFSTTAMAYASGSYIGMVNIAGTFAPKGIINGTYNGVGDAGTFSLAYSSLYERPSSLAEIAGTWTNYASGYYETVTIDSSGNITRPDISGCSSSGSISIIDSRYNIYQVNLTVDNCGSENGLYKGLSVLTDTNASNDTLVASASTATYSFIADLRRN